MDANDRPGQSLDVYDGQRSQLGALLKRFPTNLLLNVPGNPNQVTTTIEAHRLEENILTIR